MSTAPISIGNLSVTFAEGTPLEKTVFRQLSLDIPSGQFVTVIGSNGAGKSTLLNVLSGDVRPGTGLKGGCIMMGGKNVTHWPVARRARLVSRVFQNPLAGSCGDLTVEENLALAWGRTRRMTLLPALRAKRRRQFRDRVAQLSLGLENRLGDRMRLLSGGQRQAVSLVMATLAPTQILLLDEHTAALDPKTAQDILSITRQLVTEQSLTTLMVTHSMQQAIDMGDRLLMLHNGSVVLDSQGPARAALTVAELLAAFSRQQPDETIADDALLLG